MLYELFGEGHAEKAYAVATARPDGTDWLTKQAVARSEFLGYLGLGLNALVTSRAGNRRWIDQTPRNTFFLHVLADLFPDAQFLHMLRDGRRVANSMVHFGRTLGPNLRAFIDAERVPDWVEDFRIACRRWQEATGAAMDFCAQHPERCLTVVNENLVSEPERGFQRIQDFLGVPRENAPQQYFRSNRINSSFQPDRQESITRQSFPNPWDKWSEDQRSIFTEEAASTLVRYTEMAENEAPLPAIDHPREDVVEDSRTPLSAGGLKVLAAKILDYAGKENFQRPLAELVASLLPPFTEPPLHQEYFPFWQEHGFHVTPVHFREPLPDTRTLPETLWEKDSQLPGIDFNEAGQLRLLNEVFPTFRSEYEQFPLDAPGRPHEFFFNNGNFDGTDALALYCMVRHYQPRLIIEINSGFSSRVAAQAALKNGATRLVCVDPQADEILKAGFPGLAELVPKRLDELDPGSFDQLGANDILFVDSSHVSRIGSDVNILFLEVLPRLKAGVIVHFHDIFLPKEYSRERVLGEYRFWTEQYLLQAFLVFNSAYEVLFANQYLADRHLPAMQATFPHSPWWGGGSFWMRRKPTA